MGKIFILFVGVITIYHQPRLQSEIGVPPPFGGNNNHKIYIIMKISEYLALRANRTNDVVLMDVELGADNGKEYTLGYTEAGEKYTFGSLNVDSSIEEGVVTFDPKTDTLLIPRDKLITFDSGLSFVQITAMKAWSADAIKQTTGAK